MINKIKSSQIYNFYLFVGKIPLIFIFTGFLLSLGLGILEFYFALSLQLFLKFIGLLTTSVDLGDKFNISIDSFESLLIFMISLLFVRFITQVLQSQVLSYSGERINFRLRSLVIYDFLFNVSKASNSATNVYFRFNEVIPKSVGAINVSVQLLASFVQMLTFLVIMFSTLKKETFASLFGVLIIGLITLFISTFLKRVSKQVSDESHLLTIKIQKASRNLLFFKLMRLVNDERQNLTNTLYDLSTSVLRSSYLTSFASGVPSLFGGVLLITVVYLGKNYWHSDGPALISFLYLLVKFVQNLSVLSGQFATIQNYRHQLHLAFEYFKLYPKEELYEGVKYESSLHVLGNKDRSKLVKKFKLNDNLNVTDVNVKLPSISIKNVLHYYSNKNEPTFQRLTLELGAGEHLGIVGMSGAGKSTLLMLIMGVLRPKEGEILISNIDPKVYFENVQNRIGYVGAEPYLFKGTLKENLVYGINRVITEEEIRDALRIARLENFYNTVGPNYMIEEDHSGVSAGQRQRLCLARALLNKPHLLVLDEATANLDKQTEEEIALDIHKLKGICTVLIVSHQPGMLKYVDKVINL